MEILNKNDITRYEVAWKTLLVTAVVFIFAFTTANAQIAGEVCENPIVISSLPFTDIGNTGDYGDRYGPSDKPPRAAGAIGDPYANYLEGDDVVYAYTPSEDGIIDISVTEHDKFTGVFVFTGCPFDSTVGGRTSTNTSDIEVNQLPVTSGVTYYIVISTWPTPQSTPYTLNIIDLTPSCLTPTDLMVDNIMHTSAELSWASDADQSDLYLVRSYKLAPNENSVPTHTGVSSPFSVDNLTPGIEYHAYVRADCGDQDGVSEWTDPISFSTTCDAVSIPYTENFDAYGTGAYWFPQCWERPVRYNSTAINLYPSINGNTLQFQSQTDTPTYAVSPSFAEDISNLRVKFMLKREDVRSGTIDVGVMSDASDMSTFELVATIDPDNNDFTEYYFDLNQVSLSGSGNYIALRHNSDAARYNYHLDDFEVNLIPTCLEPTGLAIANITTTNAIFSWETDTDHSDVYFAEAGGAAPDEHTIPSASNVNSPIPLDQLTPNTEYNAYVRVDCGTEDGVSVWTGPVRFFTRCTATNAPFIQNFEAVTVPNIPNCGSLEANNGDGWVTYSLNTFGFKGNVLRHKNTGVGDGPVDSWYFTQGINLKAGVDYLISYVYANNSYERIEKLKVAYGTAANSSAMTEELADHEFSIKDAHKNEIVFSVDNADVYYFGFQSHSDEDKFWIYLDDIFIDVLRTCPVPSDVVVDNIGTHQAQISWTSTGQDQWEVLYGASGFNHLEDGASVTIQRNPNDTLVDLTSETVYDVYLRTICDIEDQSYWVGPQTFKTQISCPRPTNVQVVNVSHDSAQLSWEAGSNENEWIVYYGGIVGYDSEGRLIIFNPEAGEGESVTVRGNPKVTLEGLNPAARYLVYVVAVCAENDKSSLPSSAMANFNTELEGGYCMVYPENINPITNVEFANIKNLQLGGSSGPGFQDFTGMVAEVNAGETYTINLEGMTSRSTTNSFTVFIDWNQDGEFNNDDERYEVGTIYNSTGIDDQVVSMDIEVPEEAVNGTTRMRVMLRWDRNSEYVPNACDLGSVFGQVEAYTVYVNSDVNPECQIPTDLTLGAVTFDSNGAHLPVSWTPGGNETQWELSYVNTNDANDSGSAIINNTPETILDLTAGQGYGVQVRSICDGTNSDWTEVAEMTLGVDDLVFTNFTYYPNPVRNQLTLQSGVLIENVEVYNLLGQKVIQVKPNTIEVHLETDYLQSAVYLMKVSINGSQKVFRIVKK